MGCSIRKGPARTSCDQGLCCDVRSTAAWPCGKGKRVRRDARRKDCSRVDAATMAPTRLVSTDTRRSDHDRNYAITGAPRAASKGRCSSGTAAPSSVFAGYVIGVRRRVSGEHGVALLHGRPVTRRLPFEHPEMELAAKTWKGGEWWKIGGGGTVVERASCLRLRVQSPVYRRGQRRTVEPRADPFSPGGGDNLFLSSIVAVRPDTGEYVWHYQTTPGDSWDYTATQHMILAEIKIDGQTAQSHHAGAKKRVLSMCWIGKPANLFRLRHIRM